MNKTRKNLKQRKNGKKRKNSRRIKRGGISTLTNTVKRLKQHIFHKNPQIHTNISPIDENISLTPNENKIGYTRYKVIEKNEITASEEFWKNNYILIFDSRIFTIDSENKRIYETRVLNSNKHEIDEVEIKKIVDDRVKNRPKTINKNKFSQIIGINKHINYNFDDSSFLGYALIMNYNEYLRYINDDFGFIALVIPKEFIDNLHPEQGTSIKDIIKKHQDEEITRKKKLQVWQENTPR